MTFLFVFCMVILFAAFIGSMILCFKLMAKNEQLEEDERKRKFYNDGK